jgi:hypothetical protein
MNLSSTADIRSEIPSAASSVAARARNKMFLDRGAGATLLSRNWPDVDTPL